MTAETLAALRRARALAALATHIINRATAQVGK